MSKIKIKFRDLKQKSTEELLEMKKEMELHLAVAYSPMKGGWKKGKNPNTGYNPHEEKKNIARINQILSERKNDTLPHPKG